jgi:hypothetical protein
MMEKKLFDIKTPEDYYRLLARPALNDYLADKSSTYKAIAAAIFCYHLLEKKFGSKRDGKLAFNQYCKENCVLDAYESIRELSNSAKHPDVKIETSIVSDDASVSASDSVSLLLLKVRDEKVPLDQAMTNFDLFFKKVFENSCT